MKRLLAVLALLSVTACGGLPLPEGVRGARGVGAGQVDTGGGIVVVPPGPQPGSTALQLVQDYLFALSVSPEGGHAVAREFLAPGVACCTSTEAVVYSLPTLTINVVNGDATALRVKFESLARIDADGAYHLEAEDAGATFRVVRVGKDLRLSEVPTALWLRSTDVARTFTPYDVHFLARTSGGGTGARLVPDRVFLPSTAEPGQALVDALLRGPTSDLEPAVDSAAPVGTTARVRADGGLAVVDLSPQVLSLETRARQRLSAQLVWTLVPAFTGVRLTVGGRPFEVDGAGAVAGAVQDRGDWTEFDPAGVAANAPLMFLDARRVRSLDRELPDSAVTDGRLAVDAAASSPTSGQLGLRTRLASGLDEVRTGPLGGPFGDPVLARRGLTALSWGPGEQGLWVLEPGRRAVVWRIPGPDADDRTPQAVPYEQPRGTGPLTALKVSRDGSRIAMVFGGRLHVGVVVPTPEGVRIATIARISSELVGVIDVAWQSGTSLVVLGSFESAEQPFPASVAVDGSSFSVVQRPLVGAVAVEIAAAPRRPIVVAADADGRRQLFRDNGTLFRLAQSRGSAPFYPG